MRLALSAGGAAAQSNAERFADCLIPVVGSVNLRLEAAFGYLAGQHDTVPVDRLRAVLVQGFHNVAACDAMLSELDADGDLEVTLADFRAFYPEDAAKPPAMPPAATSAAPLVAGLAKVSAQQAAAGNSAYGTISPLQMQTGFFRLLQGAAYRTFRESWSANSETHQRARDLPYTVTDFVAFVRTTADFYLSLGIVRGDRAEAEFAKLVSLVEAEFQALLDRIAGWDMLEQTPAMRAAEAMLEDEAQDEADHRARFALAVDYLLALRQHGIAPEAVTPTSLDRHRTNRLRAREMHTEHGHAEGRTSGQTIPYHDSFTPVILSADQPRKAGCIMPVAFWYDSFMPQLLLCASILSDADLDREIGLDAAALDQWHAGYSANGAFDHYGMDLKAGFASCSVPVKRALRQAWRLSEHYLNSLQKRRERAEFGRESGFLSQYVSFIDLHLGRSDVADAEMRVSFPYYIGPAVWCMLHTSANMVEAMDPTDRAARIDLFKAFLRSFATMYPCPYCRYHLNRYVARNREVQSYPVEFLLLGQRADKNWFDISLDDRLATITADRPHSLQMFVWKLHNAVSSSIARSEEWYHSEDHPLYTTRFWPSFEAEIPRLANLVITTVALDRVVTLHGVTRPAVNLAVLRSQIQHALSGADPAEIGRICSEAAPIIARIEAAVIGSGLLETTYAFNPDKVDPPPHVTEDEERYARSGIFTER